jgi:hypothetical protein
MRTKLSGLVEGSKVKAFDTEKFFQVGRKRKLWRWIDSGHWIEHCEESGPLDQSPDRRNECTREDHIPSIGFERKGLATITTSAVARRLPFGEYHFRRIGNLKVELPKAQNLK